MRMSLCAPALEYRYASKGRYHGRYGTTVVAQSQSLTRVVGEMNG
jgi:hypothetical protein